MALALLRFGGLGIRFGTAHRELPFYASFFYLVQGGRLCVF
jgi:hypothetical protein